MKRELNEKGVQGVDEILAEYEEHFRINSKRGGRKKKSQKSYPLRAKSPKSIWKVEKTENPPQKDKVLTYSAL